VLFDVHPLARPLSCGVYCCTCIFLCNAVRGSIYRTAGSCTHAVWAQWWVGLLHNALAWCWPLLILQRLMHLTPRFSCCMRIGFVAGCVCVTLCCFRCLACQHLACVAEECACVPLDGTCSSVLQLWQLSWPCRATCILHAMQGARLRGSRGVLAWADYFLCFCIRRQGSASSVDWTAGSWTNQMPGCLVVSCACCRVLLAACALFERVEPCPCICLLCFLTCTGVVGGVCWCFLGRIACDAAGGVACTACAALLAVALPLQHSLQVISEVGDVLLSSMQQPHCHVEAVKLAVCAVSYSSVQQLYTPCDFVFQRMCGW
jgi:hypothetical protein